MSIANKPIPKTVDDIFRKKTILSTENLHILNTAITIVEKDLEQNPDNRFKTSRSFLDKLEWWENAIKFREGFYNIPTLIREHIEFLIYLDAPEKHVIWIDKDWRIRQEDLKIVFEKVYQDEPLIILTFHEQNIYDILNNIA